MQEKAIRITWQRCWENPAKREHCRTKEHAAGSGVPGEVVTGGEGCEMATEKSLLTKIREKELEMSVKIDEARNNADRVIEDAKKKSAGIISSSEIEGKKAASEYLRKEMEKIQGEADDITIHAIEEIKKVRENGAKNIPKAVEKTVAIVLSG